MSITPQKVKLVVGALKSCYILTEKEKQLLTDLYMSSDLVTQKILNDYYHYQDDSDILMHIKEMNFKKLYGEYDIDNKHVRTSKANRKHHINPSTPKITRMTVNKNKETNLYSGSILKTPSRRSPPQKSPPRKSPSRKSPLSRPKTVKYNLHASDYTLVHRDCNICDSRHCTGHDDVDRGRFNFLKKDAEKSRYNQYAKSALPKHYSEYRSPFGREVDNDTSTAFKKWHIGKKNKHGKSAVRESGGKSIKDGTGRGSGGRSNLDSHSVDLVRCSKSGYPTSDFDIDTIMNQYKDGPGAKFTKNQNLGPVPKLPKDPEPATELQKGPSPSKIYPLDFNKDKRTEK